MKYDEVKKQQAHYKKMSDDAHERYLEIIKEDPNFQKPKEPSKQAISMRRYWKKRMKIRRMKGRNFVKGPKIWGFWQW